MDIRQTVLDTLSEVEAHLRESVASPNSFVSVTAYTHLTRTAPDGTVIWTDAFQQALREQECIHIPAAKEPYWIDNTVIIPSNRTITADPDAVIRQCENVKVLMFRNEHPVDGSHYPPNLSQTDCNISITGGRWEESHPYRMGYGKSGMYDEVRSYYGVSTAFLFNNMENLCLRNMTFSHAAGFAIQLGQLRNALIENITFDVCFADGVHVGGNTSNLIIRNICGLVCDDLVALNAYDWKDSSVTFGPMNYVLCEHLRPHADGHRGMRILTGIYTFDDESQVDCSINNLIVRDVQGIDVFKLFLQTPGYIIGTEPERADVGSGQNLYFEDMLIDLCQPGCSMEPYLNSDPIRGDFGVFEINANLKNVHFRNISVTLHRDVFPLSWFATVGPKSSVSKENCETFDPEFSCLVDGIYFYNITINGERISDLTPYIKEIRFQDINNDGRSSGAGTVKNILPE